MAGQCVERKIENNTGEITNRKIKLYSKKAIFTYKKMRGSYFV